MDSNIWSQIRLAVTRELGVGAVELGADIERYRVSVVRDIAAYHQWSWLENVPITLSVDAGQNYITIPAYVGGEISLHQSSAGKNIKYIDPSEYDRLLATSTSTGTYADHYTIKGNRIYFYKPLAAGTSVQAFVTIDADQVENVSSPAIDGIQTRLPAHFETILEWGVLRKLDSIGRKGDWAGMYFAELEVKKDRDAVTKGRHLKVTKDRALLNARTYTRG